MPDKAELNGWIRDIETCNTYLFREGEVFAVMDHVKPPLFDRELLPPVFNFHYQDEKGLSSPSYQNAFLGMQEVQTRAKLRIRITDEDDLVRRLLEFLNSAPELFFERYCYSEEAVKSYDPFRGLTKT